MRVLTVIDFTINVIMGLAVTASLLAAFFPNPIMYYSNNFRYIKTTVIIENIMSGRVPKCNTHELFIIYSEIVIVLAAVLFIWLSR